MQDFFDVFDLSLSSSFDLLKKTLSIQENQRFQGVISSIGLVSGDYSSFKLPDNLVIIGDIHGDFITLQRIMESIDFKVYLKNESNLLIFLGDYIDMVDIL